MSVRTSVTKRNQQTICYLNISIGQIPNYVYRNFSGKIRIINERTSRINDMIIQ